MWRWERILGFLLDLRVWGFDRTTRSFCAGGNRAGDPGGIRTLDLHLERVACWASAPQGRSRLREVPATEWNTVHASRGAGKREAACLPWSRPVEGRIPRRVRSGRPGKVAIVGGGSRHLFVLGTGPSFHREQRVEDEPAPQEQENRGQGLNKHHHLILTMPPYWGVRSGRVRCFASFSLFPLDGPAWSPRRCQQGTYGRDPGTRINASGDAPAASPRG